MINIILLKNQRLFVLKRLSVCYTLCAGRCSYLGRAAGLSHGSFPASALIRMSSDDRISGLPLMCFDFVTGSPSDKIIALDDGGRIEVTEIIIEACLA